MINMITNTPTDTLGVLDMLPRGRLKVRLNYISSQMFDFFVNGLSDRGNLKPQKRKIFCNRHLPGKKLINYFINFR